MTHLTNKIFNYKPPPRLVSAYWQRGQETLEEAQAALSFFELLFPRVSASSSRSKSVHDTPWKFAHSRGQVLGDSDFAAVIMRTSLALESSLQDLPPWQQAADTTLTRFCSSMGALIAMELSFTDHQPLENIGLFIGHDAFMLFESHVGHLYGHPDLARGRIASALYNDPLVNIKFRKCLWLTGAGNIGGTGKPLHFGQCRYLREWALLEGNIHDFDEERTWIQRQLFPGGNTWPQAADLVKDDGMSIRSVFSSSSFRRFQGVALHLKLGSTPSLRSFLTKSSGRMSLDSHLSWEFEHRLGIADSKVEAALTPAQRAQQDQEAYEKMQTIEEEKGWKRYYA
ncbi:hypothetical protein LTR24_009561 [Lithohypha guttulata]|uniref:Uncharacterized protein n=1 Tax=Lithohypha guttulata TaxID=1690604 RepID=A0ABR0JWN8_9EURO|nr:hypothetical protein LTR24_009561 [Lithohypha guttulata]